MEGIDNPTDLVPFDFHLFLKLKEFLNRKRMQTKFMKLSSTDSKNR